MTQEEKYNLVKTSGVKAGYPNVYYVPGAPGTEKFAALSEWVAGETPTFNWFATLEEAVADRSGWKGEHLIRKCAEWRKDLNLA